MESIRHTCIQKEGELPSKFERRCELNILYQRLMRAGLESIQAGCIAEACGKPGGAAVEIEQGIEKLLSRVESDTRSYHERAIAAGFTLKVRHGVPVYVGPPARVKLSEIRPEKKKAMKK